MKRGRNMGIDSLTQLVIEQYLWKTSVEPGSVLHYRGPSSHQVQVCYSWKSAILGSSVLFVFMLMRKKVLKGWFLSVAFGLFSKEAGVLDSPLITLPFRFFVEGKALKYEFAKADGLYSQKVAFWGVFFWKREKNGSLKDGLNCKYLSCSYYLRYSDVEYTIHILTIKYFKSD